MSELMTMRETEEAIVSLLFSYAENAGLKVSLRQEDLVEAINTSSGAKRVTLGRIEAALLSLEQDIVIDGTSLGYKLTANAFTRIANGEPYSS